MTRAEAIDILRVIAAPRESKRIFDEFIQARDMAIKALEEPEVAIKDCRNCKYGNYNDHLETHFCYNPNECVEWNLWEPSAQPKQEEFEWCHDCKEYDQTAHCCHRWTKVIRQTVEELKAKECDKDGKKR